MRVRAVTASARNLPDLMWSMETDTVPKKICTCPASRTSSVSNLGTSPQQVLEIAS
jgi:hypothetical protein